MQWQYKKWCKRFSSPCCDQYTDRLIIAVCRSRRRAETIHSLRELEASTSGAMGNEKNRGEIGEIRTQLNAISATGSRPEAAAAKKELFKKVINCMTIGIDMSSLFMQVMTAGMSNAEDVVLKKMLYLFICTYAQSNPDLTLLTINLLNKDCKDQDPTIRGLALRSLCSLRVANLIEYIVSTGCGSEFHAQCCKRKRGTTFAGVTCVTSPAR